MQTVEAVNEVLDLIKDSFTEAVHDKQHLEAEIDAYRTQKIGAICRDEQVKAAITTYQINATQCDENALEKFAKYVLSAYGVQA